MSILMVQHPVADFEAWKKSFDSDPVGRKQNGVTRHWIYRPLDDPNYVVVSLEFASREQAEEFLPALRELWGRVGDELGFGSADNVQTRILDEVEQIQY